jgi:hypothetical protein
LGHGREALLEAHGDRDDGITLSVFLDPRGNLGEMLVLLTDIVLLAEIDEVDNGLGSEEEKRVDDLDLGNSQYVLPNELYSRDNVLGMDIRHRTAFHGTSALKEVSKSWDYRAIALCHLVIGLDEKKEKVDVPLWVPSCLSGRLYRP